MDGRKRRRKKGKKEGKKEMEKGWRIKGKGEIKSRTIFEIKIEQLLMIACLLVLFLGWSPEFSVC